MAVKYDGGAIGDAPILDGISNPGRRFTRFDDFLETNPVDNGYQLVELNDGGSEADPTAAGADERGGVVLLSTVSTNADDGGQLGSDTEFVKLDKEVYFETRIRFASSSATTPAGAAFVGLSITPGSAALTAASVHALTDMIGFQIDPDDSDSLDFVCVKNDTESKLSDIAVIDTTANSGKGVSDFMKIGFRVRNGEATVFIDGENAGTLDTNIPDDEMLGSVIAISNGNTAAACVTAVDYVMISSER
ncbi:MAG: hypothetical protein Unbinned2706contig1001_34 [Prokaryotic dsDNA virus sp.]|jgi:hypothetical protein|nr:MAG: hypothetical protein Unbinned2706contig1001_34 [Prokaryotic dsDNA virus sp.]|tara:strand:+ start:7977 stop:8720 length:744 start_codon:yes stop_codon:yes gene_type:complete